MRVGEVMYFLWMQPSKFSDKESLCCKMPRIVSAEIEFLDTERKIAKLKGYDLFRSFGVLFGSPEDVLWSLRLLSEGEK